MFITNNGLLDIDSIIINNPSYQKIMEDGVITEDEVVEHAQRIDVLLKDISQRYTSEQYAEIQRLIAEISVLIAICR